MKKLCRFSEILDYMIKLLINIVLLLCCSDDANLIRIDTLSEQTDVESLERMVGSAESDDEEASSPASENNEK